MKITESKLKQIIAEEMQKVMTEELYEDGINEQSTEQVRVTVKSPAAKERLMKVLRRLDPTGALFNVGEPEVRAQAVRDAMKTSPSLARIFSKKNKGAIAAKLKTAMDRTDGKTMVASPDPMARE